MGYKRVVRGIISSANASARESERMHRRKMREAKNFNRQLLESREKVGKKISKLEEWREKPLQALKDLYVGDKIDKKQYETLKRRHDDIPLELLVFGKAPGLTLITQYVTGKIDKKNFGEKQKVLIPEIIAEKQSIQELIDVKSDKLSEFVKKAKLNKKLQDECSACKRKKSFFCSLSGINGMLLCGTCKNQYEELKIIYIKSDYFELDPITLDENKNEKNIVHPRIKQEFLMQI